MTLLIAILVTHLKIPYHEMFIANQGLLFYYFISTVRVFTPAIPWTTLWRGSGAEIRTLDR